MRRTGILRRRRRGRGASIEMAPLIDMVFILLIFYIVSTSFVQDAGVTITRPQSAAAETITQRYVPVAITKRGVVRVAGRAAGPDDTEPIRAALREMGTNRVVVQADRDAPTGLLLRVMDTCRAAGAENVDVAAIPR